jgi:hypothetical protein
MARLFESTLDGLVEPEVVGKYFYVHRETQDGKRKTSKWRVYSGDDKYLGEISWYARWRCYVFEPAWRTIYERRCLRDMAIYLEKITRRHNQRAREERERRKAL